MILSFKLFSKEERTQIMPCAEGQKSWGQFAQTLCVLIWSHKAWLRFVFQTSDSRRRADIVLDGGWHLLMLTLPVAWNQLMTLAGVPKSLNDDNLFC